jgi:hypothetical protein
MAYYQRKIINKSFGQSPVEMKHLFLWGRERERERE